MKIASVVAAGVLMTAPLVTPVKAQGVKMAQVDMQTGRHFEDRDDRDYRDRRRYDSNATVGVGPGGVTIGPRQRCRMKTTTIDGTTAAGSRAGSASATKTARQRKARQPAGRSQYPLGDKTRSVKWDRIKFR
jgi:hypothetical protein